MEILNLFQIRISGLWEGVNIIQSKQYSHYFHDYETGDRYYLLIIATLLLFYYVSIIHITHYPLN